MNPDVFTEATAFGAVRERARLAMHWIPRGASTLLDAGCSAGYATAYFAELVESAAGIDVDEEAIRQARSRFPSIDFQPAPLERIPHPDEAFDVVVCLDVLEHVTDERLAVTELFRVLRPGGTLILTTPNRGAFGFLDPINLPKNVIPTGWAATHPERGTGSSSARPRRPTVALGGRPSRSTGTIPTRTSGA